MSARLLSSRSPLILRGQPSCCPRVLLRARQLSFAARRHHRPRPLVRLAARHFAASSGPPADEEESSAAIAGPPAEEGNGPSETFAGYLRKTTTRVQELDGGEYGAFGGDFAKGDRKKNRHTLNTP